MDRRKLLACAGVTLGVGLGGCIGDITEGNEPTCESGDAGEPIDIEQYPGTDTPPHTIQPQENAEAWNDHYLGECMDTEPSISFESFDANISAGNTADPARLSGDASHWVQMATNRDEEARFWRERPEYLREIDYDAEWLILIQTGRHSGSLRHEWMRVEETDDGVHLHGYHLKPEHPQLDAKIMTTVIAVEHDAEIDEVVVSLTRDSESRYHFTTTNGEVDLRGNG